MKPKQTTQNPSTVHIKIISLREPEFFKIDIHQLAEGPRQGLHPTGLTAQVWVVFATSLHQSTTLFWFGPLTIFFSFLQISEKNICMLRC